MNWGLQFGQVVVRCLHKSMRQDCFSCLWQKLSLFISLYLSFPLSHVRRTDEGKGTLEWEGGWKKEGGTVKRRNNWSAECNVMNRKEKHHFKEYYVWSQEFDAALERLSSVCACFSLSRAPSPSPPSFGFLSRSHQKMEYELLQRLPPRGSDNNPPLLLCASFI